MVDVYVLIGTKKERVTYDQSPVQWMDFAGP